MILGDCWEFRASGEWRWVRQREWGDGMVRGHGRVDGKGVGCRLGLMGRVGGRLAGAWVCQGERRKWGDRRG